MQFGCCLLKYYYSDQVNETFCIEALHKDYALNLVIHYENCLLALHCNTSVLYVRVHRKAKSPIVTRAVCV